VLTANSFKNRCRFCRQFIRNTSLCALRWKLTTPQANSKPSDYDIFLVCNHNILHASSECLVKQSHVYGDWAPTFQCPQRRHHRQYRHNLHCHRHRQQRHLRPRGVLRVRRGSPQIQEVGKVSAFCTDLTAISVCIFIWQRRNTRAIPKSTSDWLVKKIQNREQNFIIWNSYKHNCITSSHSCHPHLGTCRIVTLVFVVPRQRTVLPSYAASCWLHPWALRWCGSAE